MRQYKANEENALFLLNNVLNWQEFLSLPGFEAADPETCAAILTEAAKFATEVIAPIDVPGDLEGCRLVDGRVRLPAPFTAAYGAYAEAGWLSLDAPEQVGGMALPVTLNTAVTEMMNGACVSFMMLVASTRAAVHLLHEHAPEAFGADLANQVATGEVAATIVITEPQAGSSLRGLRTRAVKQDDGTWRLSGPKIFISNADHDATQKILHIVLAKTEGEDGSPGLSVFAVPNWLGDDADRMNGISVGGIEKKMGMNGSPTCQVNFEESEAWLIGNHAEGLKRMFTMMNLMRLDVAIQSVALSEAATQLALDYASERKQGGDPKRGIDQFPDVDRMLTEMRSIALAGRCLVLDVSMQLDLLKQSDSAAARQDALDYTQFMLPICKAWLSDQATRVTNLGVQVMGGYGYVTESGMEQYVRDSRVMSIYEGTNGIQALDLVFHKLQSRNGAGYELWLKRMRSDVEAAGQIDGITEPFTAALARLEQATAFVRQANKETAQAVATPYLQLAGTVALGWSHLRVAQAVANKGEWSDKLKQATFFMRYLLPESALFLHRIETVSQSD